MPFTVSHVAAALPLRAWLGRHADFSALVIGCMAPDLAYLLPGFVPRVASHDPWALVGFCLPAGWITYLLFHGLVREPCAFLLPEPLRSKLPARSFAAPSFVGACRITACLLLGAASHILWDGFTHWHGMFAEALPVLRTRLSIGGLRVPVTWLLQYASTLFGAGVLMVAGWRWLRRAPPRPVPPVPFPEAARPLLLTALVALPLAAGGMAGLASLPRETWPELYVATGRGVVSAMSAAAWSGLALGAAWWLAKRRRPRQPGDA